MLPFCAKGLIALKSTEFMEFLHVLENLKCNTRHGWTHTGRHESVAEHTFRVACMAMLLEDDFPELDMAKVIKMCLIHDWGEALTGDIPSFLKTESDEATELDAIHSLTAMLPERAPALDALFAEMEERKTPEAKFYKALDRLEAVIQHNEAPMSTWLELEKELNLTYGVEDCAPFPFLAEVRELSNEDTRRKIAAEG